MRVRVDGYSAAQLAQFRAHQRTAFAVLEETAATLREGDTEIAVTRRLRKAFRARGAADWFHVPVALFGDRTAYPGDFGAFGALPTPRVLAAGMPVILDAAPIFDGYTVDTSLAVPFGGQPQQRRLVAELQPYRALILERVRARVPLREIAREVDARIRAQGFENCHRKHIGAVLGHRLTLAEDRGWLARRRVWGLAAGPVGWFLHASFAARRGGDRSPNWNHGRESDHPPTPGLWAVEPHIALGGVGAKFEEALVIAPDGDAWWLDDDLPHHRAWRS